MNKALDRKVIEWFVSGDSGVSSETLCAAFYGMASKVKYQRHPGDPSDFGRCKRFLELLSLEDKKTALQRVAKLSKEWEGLVSKWDYLESIYGNENMFSEMQKIIDTARKEASR